MTQEDDPISKIMKHFHRQDETLFLAGFLAMIIGGVIFAMGGQLQAVEVTLLFAIILVFSALYIRLHDKLG